MYDVTELLMDTMVILLDDESPYQFSCQAGGMWCDHPLARGVLLPFPRGVIRADIWQDQELQPRQLHEVAEWLAASSLGRWLDPREGIGGEAWIPVDWNGAAAILIYPNSD